MAKATSKSRPATTPEARENQLIALAMDEAERKIREGTASSQLICHFLKLGSEKERLEREKIERENKLLEAKVTALESSKTSEELYSKAIAAMRRYSGAGSDDDYDEDW